MAHMATVAATEPACMHACSNIGLFSALGVSFLDFVSLTGMAPKSQQARIDEVQPELRT